MKSPLKIGILVLTLVVPILVYLFLRTFGENHYRLPKYFPKDVIENNTSGIKKIDTTFHTIPNFKVKDQNGIDFSLNTFEDKTLIVNFFFTRCPGICPKMSSLLTGVQQSFIEDPSIEIISFTVDPEYDSPEILKKYAQKYGVDDKKWHLVTTGNKIDVFNLGFYGFKVPSDTVDKFLHSEKIILVDKAKNIRGYYNGTTKKEADRLITEVKILKYEYEHPNK